LIQHFNAELAFQLRKLGSRHALGLVAMPGAMRPRAVNVEFVVEPPQLFHLAEKAQDLWIVHRECPNGAGKSRGILWPCWG
jgi:hypothetical protein